MFVFSGRTADEAWLSVREDFLSGTNARPLSGRTGPVQELRPAILHLENPRDRWILSRDPVMPPAAVLAEVIWILQGRRDSRVVNFWNAKLSEFAGDGESYYGAYGYRLRHAFGLDQLSKAADALRANPDTRHVCLSIWDPRTDLPVVGGAPRSPDIPCNVVSMLKIRDGRLEWTQIMRSNDFWLGLPFNVVQFTMLQEILSGWVGARPGAYTHLSDSLHLYPRDEADLASLTPYGPVPENSDDFSALDQPNSERIINDIGDRMDKLIREDLEVDEWDALLPPVDWPSAYGNLLRVLIADAARRKGKPTYIERAMASCTNPVLVALWDRWLSRKGVTG